MAFTASSLAPKMTVPVSEKYVVIDSEKLVNNLQARGFILREILRSKSGRNGHTIRMRSADSYLINGETMYPEIVIRNSYDKTMAFTCEIGIFRLVCTNGLTMLATEYGAGKWKTRHIGDEAKLAEQITNQFMDNLPAVWQLQEKLHTTILTEAQQLELAMRAAQIRWNKEFTAEQARVLLAAARPEDAGDSAWLVFNRLQESIVRGGVALEGMKRKPKPVTHARNNAQINERLFNAVHGMVFAEVASEN